MSEGKTNPSVTETIKTLEKLFEILNKQFYNGELETPVIQYYPDFKRKTEGHFWEYAWKQVKSENLPSHEINICANMVRDKQVFDVMMHEMVHLYCTQHQIKDCTNKGHFHNKEFKKAAEEHGLIASKGKKNYGYFVTALTDEAKAFCDKLQEKLPKLIFDDGTPEQEETEIETEDGEEPKQRVKRTFKFMCPKCKMLIKAHAPEINVVCVSCNEKFVSAETLTKKAARHK